MMFVTGERGINGLDSTGATKCGQDQDQGEDCHQLWPTEGEMQRR